MIPKDVAHLRPMKAAIASVEAIESHVESGMSFWVSPKLDGIRAYVRNGQVFSNSGKLIPNNEVQNKFGSFDFEGFDGELIVGNPTDKDVYRRTVSYCMSFDATDGPSPQDIVTFHVFDLRLTVPFWERLTLLRNLDQEALKSAGVCIVPHYHVFKTSINTIVHLSEKFLKDGYEGSMWRNGASSYKHGRSTLREGALLKLKPFVDEECKVVGYTFLRRNNNPAFINELGFTAHSTESKNLEVDYTRIGALEVELSDGTRVFVGTGFTDEERKECARKSAFLPGRRVKIKHMPYGAKDKPRHPTFLGFRPEWDMTDGTNGTEKGNEA